jgi:hypothetical protein
MAASQTDPEAGPLDPTAFGQRLFAAQPGRYASPADAEQELWALLRAF